MRIFRGLALSLVALSAGAAAAQPVFFDDFDGDDLLPHWSTPPDWHWEYEVSGGMLHVTDLLYPSDDHFGGNYAIMGAGYEPQMDFRADVWMGWEPGDQPHKLAMHINGPQGQIMASFGYWFDDWLGEEPVISASASGQAFRDPAPPPGIYQFTVIRRGELVEFFFDGEPFVTFVDLAGIPATSLSLEFLGPYPGQFGAVHIDRVVVVPTPGALVVLAGFGFYCANRRRSVRRLKH